MRIGELARRAGVSTKAIRHYESLGLICASRLPNGYRDYCDRDVRLVREVRALAELGISVKRTRPFLECLTTGGEQADDCPASLAEYRDAITDLDARITSLTERRSALIQRLRQAAYRTSHASPPPLAAGDLMNDLYRLPPDLPVPADDGAADHLPGTRMPEVVLPSTGGGHVALHALGEGRSVLYLYPLTRRPDVDVPDGWDNIPGARGCTPQACDFRDHHADLLAAGAARVFGLSSQDTEYQREVVDRLRLPFPMLSDTQLRLAAALDLPTFEFAGSTLYKRLTMIIRDHVIEHVFYPVFPPDQHAGQVLRWLREAE